MNKYGMKTLAFAAAMTSSVAWGQVPSTEEYMYGPSKEIKLPEPFATESATRRTSVVGWEEGKMPVVPEGFTVKKFAGDLDHPRWAYVLPNKDVLISEGNTYSKVPGVREAQQLVGVSADRVTLFRDADNDGVAEEKHVLLEDLNQPFGMAYLDGQLYIANTDALVRYSYELGSDDKITAEPEHILDIPAGGYNHHWTRNVIPDKAGKHLLLTIGSSSNVGEHGMEKEEQRAKVFRVDPTSKKMEQIAWGLRNPNGLDFNPANDELWTSVNERDELGDNLVPDYVTSVEEGGFYGWPYKYYGDHIDPRWADKMPEDLPEETLVPDYAVGPHTAAMDLAFYTADAYPEKYHNGLFVSQHGSWNRAKYAGYKVIFIPFENGEPSGQPEDFITGFLKDEAADEVYGRPTGLVMHPNGMLLSVDDDGNTVWSVQYTGDQKE